MSRKAGFERLVYVADDNQVLIFAEKGRNQPPIGDITTGIDYAYGLAVDRRGSLYVANDGNNTVTVYPRGATSPSKTFSQDLARPLYPIADASLNLWVGNANNGTVVEYLHGQTKANQVLQTDGVEADGMDFDAQGNLFVAYRGSNGLGSIEEFLAGSSQGKSLGMTLNQPQGVVVTNSGTILTVETGGTDRIDVFPPGYQTPTLELGIKDIPTELAITKSELTLFVSSLDNGRIYVSQYPLLNPDGHPNELHEKINVGNYGIVQGMALNNGQVF
jgi:sugar lactone lactonase YvrE